MSNKRRIGLSTLLFVLTFCEGAPAFQQASIWFNPEAPFSPLQQRRGELEAYEVIQDETDANRRISRIYDFLRNYPTSEFRHLVLRARWEVEIERANSERIIEAAEEALEAEEHFRSAKAGFISDPSTDQGLPEFQFTIANQKAAYYQSIVEAYKNLGDFEKMVEYGELGLTAAEEAWNLYEEVADEGTPEYQAALAQSREMRAFILFNIVKAYDDNRDVPKIIEYNERILELAPDDLQTLITTSRLMVEKPPPEDSDPKAYIRRAQGYARNALQQLEVYFSGSNILNFDAGRKAALNGEVQYILGLTYFRLEDWKNAADAYKAAIEAVPGNPLFYSMLGLASKQVRDEDTFLSAYARAVYLEIPQPRVRSDLETVYEAVHGSLEGLDEFIENEGSQIRIGNSPKGFPERTAYIDELLDKIDLLPTVFPPNRFCYQYYEFLASQDLRWAKDALEIGVGSGVNSLIILDQGVGKVVGTDINENAVRTFERNASKFGQAGNVEGRLVPLDQPEAFSVIRDDEKFDLIISNPPWEDHEPKKISEYAYLDNGWVLLYSMLAGFSDHLKENGKVWLLYGDPRVIPSKVAPAVEIIMKEAPRNNLNATVLYSNARCWIVEITVND